MKRWSSLFGALGLVGVVFGLLSVFLGLAGAPTDLYWIGANFVFGVAFLLLWGAFGLDQLRERLATGEARRAGRYGSSAVLSAAASLAIVALLAFLTSENQVRLDWSEAGLHSLSDQTLGVLEGLDQDVEIVAFYPPLEAAKVRDVLDRYTYVSDRVRIDYADPNARPDLVERHGVDAEKLAQGVVRVSIGAESVDVDEPTEENLTNSLVKLTRTGEKTVYFLEGHGERGISGEGSAEAPGFSGAADALRNENYRVESLLLATRGEVPEDADVVVIAGPVRPFLPEETRILERHLRGGGAMLVLVDPRANTDLYGPLEEWGVTLGEDVIVDRVQGLFGRATTPFAAGYGEHPITAGMRDVTMFHVARSVKARPGAGDFVELVLTGEEAWGETNLDLFFAEGRAELGGDDVRGPVPMAVAGTLGSEAEGEEAPQPGAEPRLVVFGDADFASNQLLGAALNRDLLVNSINWLLGDVEFIAIRPKSSRASGRQLTAEQVSNIRYLSLFVLPQGIAVAGVFAWWSRRRAPGR